MNCQSGCEIIKLASGRARKPMTVAAVTSSGRQAYLLAQQRLLTQRLATLVPAEHPVIVQELQYELSQLTNQLSLVS